MRSAGNNALRGALHLFQFGHQVGFGVQPSGSVHDHAVGVAGFGCIQSVEQHRCRIASGFGLDDLHAGARAPYFKLLNCGGAKCVRCA